MREDAKSIYCSPQIQQPGAAAFWLQPAVMNFDVVPIKLGSPVDLPSIRYEPILKYLSTLISKTN